MTSIVNEYVNLLDELTILCLHRVHYAKQFWIINEALLLYYFLHIGNRLDLGQNARKRCLKIIKECEYFSREFVTLGGRLEYAMDDDLSGILWRS